MQFSQSVMENTPKQISVNIYFFTFFLSYAYPLFQNGTECGVFVLSCVYSILMGLPVESSFSVDDCLLFRRKIFVELLYQKIKQNEKSEKCWY
jgi:Ulp1 family protease